MNEDKTQQEKRLDRYDYCINCLWHDGCSEHPDEDTWETGGDMCSHYTSYTRATEDNEMDEDEHSYIDELAYRQRIYAEIIYEME